MAGKEKFYDSGHSNTAAHKRVTQLREWESSETNKQPSTVLPSRVVPTIKFGDNVVFLAAAHSGDEEEVDRLVLEEGADVNSVNKDGLTALHQCCIDDDFDMVKTLVKLGANLDLQDNEGWTPLHAAASCGHAHIVSFLLDKGSFPALVNNEGDTPLELAEDYDEIIDMIQEKIDQDLIDVNAVKGVEESIMLEDANRLKNDCTLVQVVSHGGATPLHIAAAKEYTQVMRILLSLKASQVQVDAEDEDGWTPLHAAVYWGNFAAAEELVAHGADINKKTKSGDSIEDLCSPELEDDLDSLKEYGELNNRRRSNAISQNKPRTIIHSNSREDIGKHTSPVIVRRRLGSSKERSQFPKIDIAKEREERENFTGDIPAASTTTSSGGSGAKQTLPDNTNSPTINRRVNQNNSSSSDPSPSESRDVAQENDNLSKDSHVNEESSSAPPKNPSITMDPQTTTESSSSSNANSSSEPSSTESPHGSPTLKKKDSPKSAKKKVISMSPKMMLRVGKWESQKVLSSLAKNSTSVGGGAGGGQRAPVPVASSTPSSNSSSNGDRPNSESFTPTSMETKRYSFQPKTISPVSSFSSLPPRSASVDQRPMSGRSNLFSKKPQLDEPVSSRASKRSSYDETNHIRELHIPEGDYKASSLPRGARITTTTTTATPENMEVEEKEIPDIAAISTEAMATPGSQTDSSHLCVRDSREGSRELSVESNSSSRGVPDDSETSRRSRARKNRQARKFTQPIASDILEQIHQHDQLKLSKKNKSEEDASDMDATDGDGDGGVKSEVASSSPPSPPPPVVVKEDTDKGKVASDEVKQSPIMSPYKPSARPPSKIILNALAMHQQKTTPSSSSESKTKMADVVDQKMKLDLRDKSDNSSPHKAPSPPSPKTSLNKQHQSRHPDTTSTTTTTSSPKMLRQSSDVGKDDSANSSPNPRTKSTTRRRRREKRRPTGIVAEALSGEDVPDELANLVRKSGDGAMSTTPNSDHSPQSSFSEDLSDSLADGGLGEEIIRLRALLAEEQAKNKRMDKEVEEGRGKALELNRRCQDATRAYEQERKENEQKDSRIKELKANFELYQDLKHENQRMKDENSALIRVIGKLSRSPLPHSAHSTNTTAATTHT